MCAGGSAGNWHVCIRNHTEIIVLAYVSQRDAACRAPLGAYMHLRRTEHRKRVIVRVQGHSGSSGEARATSGMSDAFSGLHMLPRWFDEEKKSTDCSAQLKEMLLMWRRYANFLEKK